MDTAVLRNRYPWNKGILVGQKRPLQPKNVWSIRVRLEMSGAVRELALFNLAIDSKLRACDLVKLKVEDLWSGSSIRDRATIIQKKTKRPVQFEVTEQTKIALAAWLPFVRRNGSSYLFPSNRNKSQHLSTRQYARIVHRWVTSIGLDANAYGTHSMRRTKAAQIYKKTGNLRAVKILLGHPSADQSERPSVDRERRVLHRQADGRVDPDIANGNLHLQRHGRPDAAKAQYQGSRSSAAAQEYDAAVFVPAFPQRLTGADACPSSNDLKLLELWKFGVFGSVSPA